ncbi:MAG: hypothetical protein JW934_05575 [Anaerolineae bacterium]|nr:hypothetical protein [Anaerolineae bacterium]
MIEYRPYAVSWQVTCDRCGKVAHVATAKKEAQAKTIARRWGWQIDTPQGDLCDDCAKAVARKQASAASAAEAHPLHVPDSDLWRRVILDDEQESSAGRPRCERCGKALSLIAVPRGTGQYLCDECAQK